MLSPVAPFILPCAGALICSSYSSLTMVGSASETALAGGTAGIIGFGVGNILNMMFCHSAEQAPDAVSDPTSPTVIGAASSSDQI
mmetsp:Transcript_72316/g.88720  ORF Transcript_72316/g.88720 Transcript_72316/m.88720 type:complete len:85 (-) Transcript_72316:63-317(-)